MSNGLSDVSASSTAPPSQDAFQFLRGVQVGSISSPLLVSGASSSTLLPISNEVDNYLVEPSLVIPLDITKPHSSNHALSYSSQSINS